MSKQQFLSKNMLLTLTSPSLDWIKSCFQSFPVLLFVSQVGGTMVDLIVCEWSLHSLWWGQSQVEGYLHPKRGRKGCWQGENSLCVVDTAQRPSSSRKGFHRSCSERVVERTFPQLKHQIETLVHRGVVSDRNYPPEGSEPYPCPCICPWCHHLRWCHKASWSLGDYTSWRCRLEDCIVQTFILKGLPSPKWESTDRRQQKYTLDWHSMPACLFLNYGHSKVPPRTSSSLVIYERVISLAPTFKLSLTVYNCKQESRGMY